MSPNKKKFFLSLISDSFEHFTLSTKVVNYSVFSRKVFKTCFFLRSILFFFVFYCFFRILPKCAYYVQKMFMQNASLFYCKIFHCCTKVKQKIQIMKLFVQFSVWKCQLRSRTVICKAKSRKLSF